MIELIIFIPFIQEQLLDKYFTYSKTVGRREENVEEKEEKKEETS